MKKRIKVVCDDCGTGFEVASTTYYEHINNPNLKFRCKDCRTKYSAKINKEKWDSKSDAEKQDFSKKMSDIYHNQSDEEKQIHREKSLAYWNNISVEELNKYSEECKFRWNDKNEEDKLEFIQHLRSNYDQWRNTLSSKDKEKISEKIAEANRIRWNNLTEDEKHNRIESLKEIRDEWWLNASDEQRKLHKEKSMKYWNNLSEEDKEKYRQSKIKEWNDSLDSSYIDNYFKCAIGKSKSNLINPSPLEVDFINHLNLNSVEYKFQYTNKTYPSFFYEIYNKTKSPFHVWDFFIKTLHKNILVDIDGSEHLLQEGEFVTKDGIDVGKKIQENDSKRPYQTDGLDSYIVMAYNDTINKDTPVYKIQDGKFITFNEFMNYLNFENTYYEEIKKILKEDL